MLLASFWALAGQTPGMAFLHIRLDAGGERRIGFRRAFHRLFGLLVALMPFGLGYLAMLIEHDRRGWQDTIAETTVLYEDPKRTLRGSPVALASGRRAAGHAALTSVGMPTTTTSAPSRVLLAAPRGYCAGVDRAVQAVEHALDIYGPPVYVRKEIVHNKHVVSELAERGAIFVEEETEVPEGAHVVFSAHGVAPSVHENAAKRRLHTIDATCPLVTKVHVEARKFAAEGYTIVLIGHDGHEEVEGTTGEAPGLDRAGRDRAGRRRRSRYPIRTGSLSSRRRRCRSTRPPKSSPRYARSSRISPRRSRTTSVTRRPIASSRSSSWRGSATSCS